MLLTDIFSAEAVTIRQASDPSNNEAFLGTQFFPVRRTMGVELKWIKTHRGLGVALKPSALDAMATIRTRGGFKAETEQMPLFRESMMISEKDIVEIQRAQQSNDPYLNEVLRHLYDDAAELIRGAEISAERMRMSLIAPQNGEPVIKIGMADNTQYNYDYDDDGEWKKTNYLALTGTDCWDAPDTATPLNDIQTGVDYLSSIGVAPAYLVMNSTTLNLLTENEQIQKMFAARQYGVNAGYLDKNTVKSIISGATGLTVLEYNKQYKDYDGTSHKYYPDGYVSIIGTDMLGYTYAGVTPEERTLIGDPKVDVSVMDNGIAIAVQTTYGPPVQYSTTASMIALPSFEGMDSIYAIKVTED